MRRSALAWFGCLGSPAAWATQFSAGYAFAEAACSNKTAVGAVETVAVWLSVGAAATAIASLAAAVLTRRAVERHDLPDPRGRVALMATTGILGGIVFLALIAFTAAMIGSLDSCEAG